MSSAKRIPLMTLGPLEKKPEPKSVPKSIRLTIQLDGTTQDYFPFINYQELLGKQLKKIQLKGKQKDANEGESASAQDNPFAGEEEAENDHLVEIARRFEEKYGGTSKRRPRLDGLEELGDGYDESDSFVDNSEALEEIVPDELSPELGGFYINKGPLQSKKNDDLFLFHRKKKTVTLVSSESEADDAKPGPSRANLGDGTPSSSSGKKKKKHKDKEKKSDSKHSSGKKKKKKDKKSEPRPKSDEDENTGSSVSETIERVILAAKNNEIKTPKLKRQEDKVKGAKAVAGGGASSSESVKHIQPKDKDCKSEKERDRESTPAGAKPAETPKPKPAAEEPKKPPPIVVNLPGSLPDEVSYLINILKTEHGESERDAKLKRERGTDNEEESDDDDDKLLIAGKTFPGGFRQHLMKLEKACRGLDVEHRTQVFAHLGSVFDVKEDELRRTSREMVKGEESRRLKPYLLRLKEAVARIMPELEKRHQDKCRAAAEGRADDGSDYDSEDGAERGGDKPKTRMPRRKFVWTEEVRECFLDVVQIKVKMFEEDQTPGLDAEAYFKDFFEQKVKTLWPKNWMNARELFKESRNVHGPLTNKTRRSGQFFGRKPIGGLTTQQSVPPPSTSPGVSNQNRRSSPSPAAAGLGALSSSAPNAVGVPSYPLQAQQLQHQAQPQPPPPQLQQQQQQPQQRRKQQQPPADAMGLGSMETIFAAMAEQMKVAMAGEMLKNATAASSSGAAAAAAAAAASQFLGDDAIRAMLAMGINPATMAALLPGFGNLGMPMKQPSSSGTGSKRHSGEHHQVPEKRRKTDPSLHAQSLARIQTPPTSSPSNVPLSLSPKQLQQQLLLQQQQEHLQHQLLQQQQQEQKLKQQQQEQLKAQKEQQLKLEKERQRERQREREQERQREREQERQREREQEQRKREEERKERERERVLEKEREREEQQALQLLITSSQNSFPGSLQERQVEREQEERKDRERERALKKEREREDQQALQLLITSAQNSFPNSIHSLPMEEDVRMKSPRATGTEFRPSTPDIQLYPVDAAPSASTPKVGGGDAKIPATTKVSPLKQSSSPVAATTTTISVSTTAPASISSVLSMAMKASACGLEVTAIPRVSTSSAGSGSSAGTSPESVYKPHKRSSGDNSSAPVSSASSVLAGAEHLIVETSKARDLLGMSKSSALTLTPIASTTTASASSGLRTNTGPRTEEAFDFSVPFSKASVSVSKSEQRVSSSPVPPPPAATPPKQKTSVPQPKTTSFLEDVKMPLPILSFNTELDLTAGFDLTVSPSLPTGGLGGYVESAVDYSNSSRASSTTSLSRRSPPKSSAYDLSQQSLPYQSKKMQAAAQIKSLTSHKMDMTELLHNEIMKTLGPSAAKTPSLSGSGKSSSSSQLAGHQQFSSSGGGSYAAAAGTTQAQGRQAGNRTSPSSRSAAASMEAAAAALIQEGLGSRVGQSIAAYSTVPASSSPTSNRGGGGGSSASSYQVAGSTASPGQLSQVPGYRTTTSSSSSGTRDYRQQRPAHSGLTTQQSGSRSSSQTSASSRSGLTSSYGRMSAENPLSAYQDSSSQQGRYQASSSDMRMSSSSGASRNSGYANYSTSSHSSNQQRLSAGQQQSFMSNYVGAAGAAKNFFDEQQQQQQRTPSASAGHPGYYTSSAYQQQQRQQQQQPQNQGQNYGHNRSF